MKSLNLSNVFKTKTGLIFYEICLGLLIYFLNLNPTASLYIFLSWNIPSIYYLYKLRSYRVKAIITSFLWCIPASLIIDLLGHYTKIWSFWDNPLFSSSGIKILDVPIESFYWGFSAWLFSVLIYEFYFDKHKGHKFRRSEKLLIFILTIVSLICIYIVRNRLIGQNEYFYVIILVLYGLFDLFMFYKYKKLRIKILYSSLFLFILGLIIEFFSFSYSLWDFNGKFYLYTITLCNKPMPIEEIIGWLIFPMAALFIHEVFVDTGD